MSGGFKASSGLYTPAATHSSLQHPTSWFIHPFLYLFLALIIYEPHSNAGITRIIDIYGAFVPGVPAILFSNFIF